MISTLLENTYISEFTSTNLMMILILIIAFYLTKKYKDNNKEIKRKIFIR